MKYRAVANGNIVEDVHPSLVEAGIYVPVGRVPARPVAKKGPEPAPKKSAPQKKAK